MANKTADDVAEVGATFDNLTDSIQKAATQSNKLRTAFLQLSSAQTSKGQAWTVLSRLTSGTGFWRVQNRIRAISNFLKFQDKKQEEIAENENAAISRLAQQIKLKKDISKATETLQNVMSGTADIEERSAFYQSEQFKYLEQMYGSQQAMVEMTERLGYATEQLSKTDVEMLNQRVKSHKTMLEKGLTFRELFMPLPKDTNELAKFNNLSDVNQRKFIEYSDSVSKFAQLTKDITASVKERDTYKGEVDAFNLLANLNGQITDEDKDQLKTMKEKLKTQNEFIDGLREEKDRVEKLQETRKNELDADGIKVGVKGKQNRKTGGVDYTGELKDSGDRPSLSTKLFGVISKKLDSIPGGNLVKGFGKGMSKFFKSNDKMGDMRKLFKKIAKPLGMVLRGVLLYLPLILLLLMVLKESGWFDVIVDTVKGIVRYVYNIYVGFLEFIVTIGDLFGTIIAFVGVIFNGKSGEAYDAFYDILVAAFDVFLALGELVLVDIIGGIFINALGGLAVSLYERYFESGFGLFGQLYSIAADAFIMFGVWKLAHIAYMAFGPLGGLAAGLAAFFLGDSFKGWIGGLLGLKGFADGGPVNRTGSYLVGERGPEIVTMQGGSYVTPNHQLGGSTTINVSVNGRIGASDQELNELANKLSSIINQKMQRTGSTGVFR
jgi:hypothetical protein